ncbi:MAG: YIP1 family protein [Desulfobacteraceae bacterium]|nr:YIP1 family protein [Desulfobacteraceae bacterium]
MSRYFEASVRFSVLREYACLMRRIITGPRGFFREYAVSGNTNMPIFALATSSLFYACASLLTYTCPKPAVALVIFFVNAAGITLLTSVAGYLLVRIVFKTPVTFRQVFGIYAYASAAALLVAWLPYLLLLAEVWRWWLIGVGLIIVCRLKPWQAFLVIGITVGSMVFGYWELMNRLM